MTTLDALALPSGLGEDDYFDLVEETGDRAIAQLLEECGNVELVESMRVAPALVDLASALSDALLDDDLGAPRGIAPHSHLRDHADFPDRLGLRVLGALHLVDALESSASPALLAGLLARRRLLDGETVEALELAVLAAAVGTGSRSVHTGLSWGVLAAALQRCGQRRPAAGIHLMLDTAGIGIEAWRDAEEWSTCAPWVDGACFEQWLLCDDGSGRRAPYPDDEPRSAFARIVADPGRAERFGLWRHLRRRRDSLSLGQMLLALEDLEDLAIQEEWAFL